MRKRTFPKAELRLQIFTETKCNFVFLPAKSIACFLNNGGENCEIVEHNHRDTNTKISNRISAFKCDIIPHQDSANSDAKNAKGRQKVNFARWSSKQNVHF